MQTTDQTAPIVPAAKVRSQALDVVEDSSLARLLFCEILLEEYESLNQPELEQSEVNEIRAEIEKHWLKDEEKRALDEPEFEGRTVKRLYRAMNVAQRARVKQIREALKDKHKDVPEAQREQAVNDEFLGHVLGETYKRSQKIEEGEDQSTPPPQLPGATSERPVTSGEAAALAKNKSNGDHLAAFRGKLDAEKLEGKTLRSALCLSGGGIRSATFNLGILQGLARHGLLEKFDYLSTVSGGGFIGGWLSAWIRRDGIGNVVEALRNPPETPLTPDPPPVEHLRVYSNYLSPQPGLLSADTWTLIATFVRNLVLNWLVFVPVLLVFLLLPRIWTSIVLRSSHHPEYAITLSLILGFLSAMWALSYVAASLPSSNDYKSTPPAEHYKGGQGGFISRCLVWLIVSSAALAVCLWSCYLPGQTPLPWLYYAGFAVAVMIVPLIIFVAKVVKTTDLSDAKKWVGLATKLVVAIVLILLVQVIIGYLASSLVLATRPIFHQHPLAYSIFSVPIILLLMSLQGLLIAGFTSRFSKDADQEWWARAGAWILIVAVAWSIVHTLVIYGPLLLLALVGTFRKLEDGGLSRLAWADVGTLFGTIAGIVSGAITLLGGFSAKTPANSKEAEKAGMGGALLAMGTQLLAPIFLCFLIILLSLGTNLLLISRPAQSLSRAISGYSLPVPSSSPALSPLLEWHTLLIRETSFRLLVVVAILIGIFGIFMGRIISTNVFSLQFMWRNRIIRAYLGASRKDKRRPDRFTGFDGLDNLQMHELWPQPGSGSRCGKREDRPDDDLKPERFSRKLFHVLNMALNLTGGEKLQWQDRKAESFTVSPLHSGSYWLGYRRSTHYGGRDGITLGASIAISGAFVSPNMGFMMTSPVVRFLMAIFNVRFGWWLGNPGVAGDETNVVERLLNAPAKVFGHEVMRPFRLDSPRLSVIPFLSEAVGNIDDKSSYVYLSDGGHFENLGLYEMVLRRCRFIVVCDATTDPDYSFESLATSIRQIRVDLGVPIDIPELTVGVPSQNLKNKYCAIGTIRYSCVDRDPGDKDTTDEDFDGILIFIKPSLIGNEPRDVVNYWQGRSSFPQEVITDQWFSEAQFESYRTLGSSIIEGICDDKSGKSMTLAAFSEKVQDHNRLNFRAFKEEVSFLALESEIRELLQKAPISSYRTKVRSFIKDIIR